MRILLAVMLSFGLMGKALATNQAIEGEYLIKVEGSFFKELMKPDSVFSSNVQIEDLGINGWFLVRVPESHANQLNLQSLSSMHGVLAAEKNLRIQLSPFPGMEALREAALQKYGDLSERTDENCPQPGACTQMEDNPAIPAPTNPGRGADPLLSSQWGMMDIGVEQAWKTSKGNRDIVVAVIDTGIDYTHEDIVDNLWRNPGEMGTDSQGRDKSNNGIDDDGNGFIDDVIGWDFVSDDNKPYDLTVPIWELLFGGNPGHGTHVAGCVAARGFNGKGISGVAPNVSMMGIRFLSEKGSGTLDGAIKSIKYAADNGAHITNNSWGGEGALNDPEAQALRDAIQYAEDRGLLFVAAAGNGRNGQGYDNDNDSKPAIPASYRFDSIISVAALDQNDQLGPFSNWGRTSVHIGAPGVKVFSSTVGNNYSDTVLDFMGMTIHWDGTSMAAPHVAGAAALYMSHYPNATYRQVKDAIIRSAKPISAMQGKAVSNGKLNVESLMKF